MSARDFSSFRLMIMTSVGGRAHRGPVTGSARAGLGGPRTRIGADRRTRILLGGPQRSGGRRSRCGDKPAEAGPSPGTGPRWVSAGLLFSIGFQIAAPPPRVTCEKAGPRGPAFSSGVKRAGPCPARMASRKTPSEVWRPCDRRSRRRARSAVRTASRFRQRSARRR